MRRYSNEEFNVVDRGGGFCSIHTLNARPGLCLNISNGTKSLAMARHVRIETAPPGAYRIKVRGSGLCLEDPGSGGTLRQNRCDAAAVNQKFSLVD